MNPYRPFVTAIAEALAQAAKIGAAAVGPARMEAAEGGGAGPKALIFAPHPDDEVIVGALPLRLRREAGWLVTNVAVTLGSRRERRAGRWLEAEAACRALGFGLITPDEAGLEHVSPSGRAEHPGVWRRSVALVAGLLEAERPEVVFVPHAGDWNRTHVGTHLLVGEALELAGLGCTVVETEFWGAMAAPNLMVESSVADVADLVAALSLHEGEVARNPYHLRLPGWMMDNVRRGAELVFGQGSAAPGFAFATLYRVRGGVGRALAAGDGAGSVFAAD